MTYKKVIGFLVKKKVHPQRKSSLCSLCLYSLSVALPCWRINVVIATLEQLTICVEQENEATEGATQQEDVSESYQLMQQQLKQANETIATLMEQNSRVQSTTSQTLIMLLLVRAVNEPCSRHITR